MANAALSRGHRVLGTLRNEAQRKEFEGRAPGRAIGRLLDVTNTAAIQPLVESLEDEYGPIDVLINNAGYGLRGVIEELDLDELRRQFEVNVFAPIALIQAVLPKMRTRADRSHHQRLIDGRCRHIPQPWGLSRQQVRDSGPERHTVVGGAGTWHPCDQRTARSVSKRLGRSVAGSCRAQDRRLRCYVGRRKERQPKVG